MMVSKNLNLKTDSKIKLLTILGSKFLYVHSSMLCFYTDGCVRPVACAVARLPFIHAAYNSSNYTIALYKLGMPTQIQLHLSIVSLSLGRIFRFLAALDVGYLASSIEPTTGKGSKNRSQAGRYGYGYGKPSKGTFQSSRHSQKRSISDQDSSKGLVPDREWSRLDAEIPLEQQSSRTYIRALRAPRNGSIYAECETEKSP